MENKTATFFSRFVSCKQTFQVLRFSSLRTFFIRLWLGEHKKWNLKREKEKERKTRTQRADKNKLTIKTENSKGTNRRRKNNRRIVMQSTEDECRKSMKKIKKTFWNKSFKSKN